MDHDVTGPLTFAAFVLMLASFAWASFLLRNRPAIVRNFSYIDPGRRIPGAAPCPFCDNPELVFDVDPDEKYHVCCETCGIWGPAGADEPRALAIWNLRA